MTPAEGILRWFAYAHLPAGPPHEIAVTLPVGPEQLVALRKLLEAKDAAVRSALDIPVPVEQPTLI